MSSRDNAERHLQSCGFVRYGIAWTRPRYPGGDAENGPARRNPINGCVACGDTEAEDYTSLGYCFACVYEGKDVPPCDAKAVRS